MAIWRSLHMWCSICYVFYAFHLVQTLTEDDDYVPNFFSGRRQDGEHAGIDPSSTVSSNQRALVTNVKEMKFVQKLDHFNDTCRKSWTQRYLINEKHFNPNHSRPIIFIRIGGESSVNQTDLIYGRMVKLAKRHGALLLELEHRYYGESKPTKNLKVENLRFLSHLQALMDLEAFIQSQKRPFIRNGQFPSVILYGCSYAGSLAAFHRAHYSNSTVGALSVCAPLTAQTINQEHQKASEDAISRYDPLCKNNTATAISAIQAYFIANGTLLTRSFQLCEPKPSGPVDWRSLEYQTFYYELNYRILQAAQYNRMSLGEQSELGVFCRTMSNQSIGDPAERYFTWLNSTGRQCLKHDGLSILSRNVYWNSTMTNSGNCRQDKNRESSLARQWLYQMCTEFGYFSGLLRVWDDQQRKVAVYNFPTGYMDDEWWIDVSMDYKIALKICNDSFGIIDTDVRIRKTESILYELMGQASKIVFIQGKLDPWRDLGGRDYLLHTEIWNYPELWKDGKPLVENYRAVRDIGCYFPNNASHCEEPSGSLSNYPDLIEAYESAEAKITTWISGRWDENFQKPNKLGSG